MSTATQRQAKPLESTIDPAPGDFTGLAENYSKYRPSYSETVLDALIGLLPEEIDRCDLADIGAGTGIWTRQLVMRNPASIIAVEPNDDMRQHGVEDSKSTHIEWRAGTGENTGLGDATCHMVSMASSFHWVNAERGLQEFHRVLRPGGRFVALWNPRLLEISPLLLEIENKAREMAGDERRVSSGLSGRADKMTGLFQNSDLFDDVIYLEGRHTVALTPPAYIGVWRSVNDWRVKLGPQGFEDFIAFVEDRIKNLDQIETTYLTRAWSARKT